MNDPAPDKRSLPFRSDESFSLQALFLLVTAVAALLACIDFSALSEETDRMLAGNFSEVVFMVLTTAVLGAVVGAGVGLGQLRPLRGAAICGLAGSIAAVAILMTCVAPARPIQAAVAVALPVVMTLLLRFRTK